jgi:hypothetical protein
MTQSFVGIYLRDSFTKARMKHKYYAKSIDSRGAAFCCSKSPQLHNWYTATHFE